MADAAKSRLGLRLQQAHDPLGAIPGVQFELAGNLFQRPETDIDLLDRPLAQEIGLLHVMNVVHQQTIETTIMGLRTMLDSWVRKNRPEDSTILSQLKSGKAEGS